MARSRPAIPVRSPEEQELMRAACRLTGAAMRLALDAVKPGVTTAAIDRLVEEFIQARGATPAFKGYQGYPAATCISINEQLIHGIPGQREIRDGDVVSIDLGVRLNGLIGDAARTVVAGMAPPYLHTLIATAEGAFNAATAVVREGVRVGDISHAVQEYCEGRGYQVVRAYVGHGVGRMLHEPPQIPNYGAAGSGAAIPAGATLAIEPMLTMESYEVRVAKDKWTVLSADGLPCAHHENTVLVTATGCEVLTTVSWQTAA
ncbi:type I methionyl aminopeptidase [bacterium]|nr:type I methionyl aminopeptidase [bacterium]